MFGKRILLLVPHPDDELVACAAALGRAQKAGAEIYALYLTNGCIAREALWPWQRKNYQGFVAKRRGEAETVAKFLHITPVGWATRPARHLWQELPQVQVEIQLVLGAHSIDQLWVPAYEGGNPDHDALNALGRLFAFTLRKNRTNSPPLEGGVRGGGVTFAVKFQDRNRTSGMPSAPPPNLPHKGGGIPPVLEFAEYNFLEGKTHSQDFPYPNGTEHVIALTPEEQKKKRAALAFYESEKQNLNYVDVQRECYRPLADYDYSQPPHPGTLWYTRFQWVPFRHPRVDFTRPEEVSKAIMVFSATTALPAPARR